MRNLLVWGALVVAGGGVGCVGGEPVAPPGAPSTVPTTARLRGEVWADNWFAFYVGDVKIAEDSVPITTERSFNAEVFTFDATYPLDLSFVIRDYIQDDSGLEYIGTPNQQMGDGGFIMQLTDLASGRVVAVSDQAMRCLVVHKAPLNPACEKSSTPASACQSLVLPEPAGWHAPGFDATGWAPATVYTAAQVAPKEGYNTIRWDPSARLVWTADLKADNTLLCKVRVERR